MIRERRDQALNYEKYLQKVIELARQVLNKGGGDSYPPELDTAAKRALFDNLGKNTALALALDEEILATRQDEWRGNLFKERAVKAAIQNHISDDEETERIFQLVKKQKEY